MSHNQSLIQIKKAEWIKEFKFFHLFNKNLAFKTIQEHDLILQALFQQDAPAAEKAMRAHIIGAAQRAGVYFSRHDS